MEGMGKNIATKKEDERDQKNEKRKIHLHVYVCMHDILTCKFKKYEGDDIDMAIFWVSGWGKN